MSTKKISVFLLLATFVLACTALTAAAQDQGDPRAVIVEDIRNENASFMVRVDVDHENRIYNGGDVMKVSVVSEKPGYLYLFYCDADKNVAVLFPNRVQKDNHIQGGTKINVPHADSKFRLRVAAPFGKEVLKAVVSESPLRSLDLESLIKRDVTPVKLEDIKIAFEDDATNWAEHDLEIKTLAPGESPKPKQKRVGLFVGISDYQSDTINDLGICHKDAEVMAQTMKKHCQLDSAIVLTESDATLANVEKAIRKTIKENTQVGDEVFIFWSGHGARIPDDNGDEMDKFDEALVTYDASTEDLASIRRTMLVDDAFGRWLQDLDGRKIVVILDTCHSGGQHKNGKGLQFGNSPKGDEAFDLFDGEFNRAKDIGQKETALLASSKATEVSFVRREGDLSAMTYFLVEQLSTGKGKITLEDAFKNLASKVPTYIEGKFKDESQTPVLVDNTTPPLYLRRGK